MKILTSAVILLLLQLPPAAPPASLTTTLRQLREHLDEHRATFGATAELTAAKHQLRDWIESRLGSGGQAVDIRAFAATLHTSLDAAKLLCNDLHEECDWNFLGYVDDVRISRAGDFLIVVTAMGIWCGYDESAYAYAWEGGQWRRVWEHERTTYTKENYLPQTIHDVLISEPDANRGRLIVTLGSQTICGGAYKDIYARAWQLDANGSRSVLDWTAHASDNYPPIMGRVLPGDVLIAFTTGGILSGEVHTAVRHFRIDQGTVKQIDPIASLPRDFVVEWLSAPWTESRDRTERPALEAVHAALHRNDGVGDFPRDTLRCTGGSDLWQVATHLYERPQRYFRVRWRDPSVFTIVDVSETPYSDCTVMDDRAETYPDVLTTALR